MAVECLLNRHDIENGGNGNPSVIDPGGTWDYTSGPASILVNAVTTYNVGDSLTVEGDDFCVTMDTCGEYTFTYFVPGCALSSSTLTINVADVELESNPGTSCDYQLTVENPDNGTAAWKHETVVNSINSVSSVQAIVTETCGGGSPTVISSELATITDCSWGRTGYICNSSDSLGTDGYIEFIRVHRDDGAGNVTFLEIPLEESLVIAAGYDVGCAGTVNTPDLVVSGAASAPAFRTAIEQVIENALCDEWGATNGVDYDLLVEAPTAGAGVRFLIRFVIKHAPTSQWIGVDVNDLDILWYRNSFSTRTEANITNLFSQNNCSTTYSYEVPCGNFVGGTFSTFTDPGKIDESDPLSTFNNVVPSTTNGIAIGNDGGITANTNCTEYLITSTLCGISSCVNPEYTWNGPDGFSAITQNITVNTTGTYNLSVTCDNLSCTVSSSILIT